MTDIPIKQTYVAACRCPPRLPGHVENVRPLFPESDPAIRRSLKISITQNIVHMLDRMSIVPILGHVLIHSNDSKHASLNMQVGGHHPSKERMWRCNLVAVGRCHRKRQSNPPTISFRHDMKHLRDSREGNCWRSMKPATPRSAQVPFMAAAEVVAIVCRAAQNACHALRCLVMPWVFVFVFMCGHSLASMSIQIKLTEGITTTSTRWTKTRERRSRPTVTLLSWPKVLPCEFHSNTTGNIYASESGADDFKTKSLNCRRHLHFGRIQQIIS